MNSNRHDEGDKEEVVDCVAFIRDNKSPIADVYNAWCKMLDKGPTPLVHYPKSRAIEFYDCSTPLFSVLFLRGCLRKLRHSSSKWEIDDVWEDYQKKVAKAPNTVQQLLEPFTEEFGNIIEEIRDERSSLWISEMITEFNDTATIIISEIEMKATAKPKSSTKGKM
jgi:hypothetical protein